MEVTYCKTRKKSYIHFAARFCCQGSSGKSDAHRLERCVSLADIEVVNDQSGAPHILLSREVAKALEQYNVHSLAFSHRDNSGCVCGTGKQKIKKIFFVQLPIAQSLLITRQNEINWFSPIAKQHIADVALIAVFSGSADGRWRTGVIFLSISPEKLTSARVSWISFLTNLLTTPLPIFLSWFSWWQVPVHVCTMLHMISWQCVYYSIFRRWNRLSHTSWRCLQLSSHSNLRTADTSRYPSVTKKQGGTQKTVLHTPDWIDRTDVDSRYSDESRLNKMLF